MPTPKKKEKKVIVKPKKKEQVGTCKIMSGELVEIEGKTFHRYIILSNKAFGYVGQEYSV